jgi:hypothetical protein
MSGHAAAPTSSLPVVPAAGSAMRLEFVDVNRVDGSRVEGGPAAALAFADVRVGGRLSSEIRTLVPGAEYEVVVPVGDQAIGVAVRVIVGCSVVAGAAATVAFAGLGVAGRRLHSTPPPPPGLAGRLEEVALVDIVQLVCIGRRDAAIVVRSEGAAGGGGVVFCRGGRAVFASGDDGTEGEAAFFALVAASAGTFAVRYGVDMVGENLGNDTTWLLLEALRRLDEAAAAGVVVDHSYEHAGAGGGPVVSRPPASAATSAFAAAHAGAAEPAGDEEHAAEPLFTPRVLRRHTPAAAASTASSVGLRVAAPSATPSATASTSDASSMLPSMPAAVVARRAPVEAMWPPLPSRATGRFARFFDELSEVTRPRAATASLPPEDDIRRDAARVSEDEDRSDVVAALFDSDDRSIVDDDATARLRIPSLPAGRGPADGRAGCDTTLVRPSRPLST